MTGPQHRDGGVRASNTIFPLLLRNIRSEPARLWMGRASRDGLLTMRELGGYHPRDKNV
jgi:hypothetical protein